MTIEDPEVLWTPDPERARTSAIVDFATYASSITGRNLDGTDYARLHEWSITQPAEFWGALADFFGVAFHSPPTSVLVGEGVEHVTWFEGASLNYAEQALRPGPGHGDNDLAVVSCRESGPDREVTYGELRDLVASVRAGLRTLGVGMGDRVVGLVPNSLEALVAFLATASLGAIWSSCSPDFGSHAAIERFAQLEPVVLFAVDGYTYGGRDFDVMATASALAEALPGTIPVVIPQMDSTSRLDHAMTWSDLLASSEPLEFEPVPFTHPLWVLFSSGTTGLPKGIVQGHGGILLEHLKALGLHHDLGQGDRFFWYTTTGWMMWNYLVSGLLVGATVILYDGSPTLPSTHGLFELAAREQVTFLGMSAPYVHACMKSGEQHVPRSRLASVRALGSTGAPLSNEGFGWLAEYFGPSVQIGSTSGGTDLCTAFLGVAPTVPVWRGEISCATLGADAVSLNDHGEQCVDDVGELALLVPMPSMPVAFWNDPDGRRLHEAYFEDIPGRWRHGDWVKRTPRGSYVLLGRSDATLNRGGVRMGTAEFYAVIEAHKAVRDCLVVDTSGLVEGDEGRLLCFLVLDPHESLDQVEPDLRKALRQALSPRHVPDTFIRVDDIPRTLNGKRCEVPVRRILAGVDPERAVSRDSLANPEALDPFVAMAPSRSGA